MDEVLIFVININNCIYKMKKLFKYIKNIKSRDGGEMSLEIQVVILFVILFFMWFLLGGNKRTVENKSLFLPINQSQ